MARILALADEECALGFRLSGIDAEVVASPEELQERLLRLQQAVKPRGAGAPALYGERNAGIVLFDQEHLGSLPERLQRWVDESNDPILVPIPMLSVGPRRPSGREEYIARLLRRVIGYQVKIRR